MIDVHVHLCALPTRDNGCHVSRQALARPVGRILMRRFRIDPADPAAGNQRYIDCLHAYLRQSRHLRKAVLLALDGVYDRHGRLDRRQTHFAIANSFLLQVCREHPEFLPGVSVHPLRRDALDELDRCAAAGAVLVKWLPNSQGIDPADPRFVPFYRRLAALRLPLLTHSGHEFTLVAPDQSLGDPKRLERALGEGVIVIAAHGGSSGLPFIERHRPTVERLVRQYPNFYLDSSALCSPNRVGMALIIRRSPHLQERLLYGSDYPVPVFASQFALHIRPGELLRLFREKNPLDKHLAVEQALGYRFAPLPAGTRLAEAAAEIAPTNAPAPRSSHELQEPLRNKFPMAAATGPTRSASRDRLAERDGHVPNPTVL